MFFYTNLKKERARECLLSVAKATGGNFYSQSHGTHLHVNVDVRLHLRLQPQPQLQSQLRLMLTAMTQTAASEPTETGASFRPQVKTTPRTIMVPWRKLGCFMTVFALFFVAAVGAVLNISSPSRNTRSLGGKAPYLAQKKNNEPVKPPQVAVCFFGLTRSLRWTLPSIQRRLLGVLRNSGMKVDVFVHTYQLVEVGTGCASSMAIGILRK